MNDYYTRRQVAEAIEGYFLPSPSKPGGDNAEFNRARAEYVSVMKARIEIAESLTFNEATQLTNPPAAAQ